MNNNLKNLFLLIMLLIILTAWLFVISLLPINQTLKYVVYFYLTFSVVFSIKTFVTFKN